MGYSCNKLYYALVLSQAGQNVHHCFTTQQNGLDLLSLNQETLRLQFLVPWFLTKCRAGSCFSVLCLEAALGRCELCLTYVDLKFDGGDCENHFML